MGEGGRRGKGGYTKTGKKVNKKERGVKGDNPLGVISFGHL